MSERKTISINPELFSLSGGNTTRKKRPAKENKDLKIKTSAPKQPQSTKTLRNRLLHYIRKNQEENFKKMHGAKPEIEVQEKKYAPNVYTDNFNNDFEQSLKYMTEIAEQVSNKVDNDYMMNQTLRNYKSLNPESVLSGTDFSEALDGLTETTDIKLGDSESSMKLVPPKQPQWGCMKGGTLPTYRLWKNQTQKIQEHNPHTSVGQINIPKLDLGNMSMSSIGAIGGNFQSPDEHVYSSSNIQTAPSIHIGGTVVTDKNNIGLNREPINNSNINNNRTFDQARVSQLKQTMEKINTMNKAQENNQIKYGKRKKTIRRTYKLGKSRVTPKVSVLVSNKTVRKNISTKKEKLKQTPIEEIRAVLIKKGFIKVGSLATNDVLRKMYESMLLVCGEVENHNPENLLYNYLNA